MLSVCLSRAGEMGEDNNGRRLKKSAKSRSCASAGAENFFFSSSTARKKISRFPTLFVAVQKRSLFNTFSIADLFSEF